MKSLVFNGFWRNRSKSFFLLVSRCCFVGLHILFPLYHRVWLLLNRITGSGIFALQLTSDSRCCISTTLLRSWLSWRSIVLLHLSPFGRAFNILMQLWAPFLEIPCCSWFSFCSIGGCCSSSPFSSQKILRKVCLL